MSAEQIAQSFVEHFYAKLGEGSSQELHGLYTESSMLTFEGAQVQGADGIVAKLAEAGPLSHNIVFTDMQPVTDASMLIVVTGHIRIGDNNPLHFSETFTLFAGETEGTFNVHNQVFRLNYA